MNISAPGKKTLGKSDWIAIAKGDLIKETMGERRRLSPLYDEVLLY